MIKILKDKKGVTLIELVVAMSIFAIMTVAVLFVLVPTLKTYEKANELAEVNAIIDTVAMEIRDEISRSVYLPIISGSNVNQSIDIYVSPNNIIKYEVSDGILMKSLNDEEFYAPLSKSFYRNMKIEVAYEESTLGDGNGKIYLIQLSILNYNDTLLLSREYAVKPLVLNQLS